VSKKYKIYHNHTTEKEIEYYLYSTKKKIPCVLIEHYGSHVSGSDYNYLYKQEIKEI
jgi:hypothetical protein